MSSVPNVFISPRDLGACGHVWHARLLQLEPVVRACRQSGSGGETWWARSLQFFNDVGTAYLLIDHVPLATVANNSLKLIFAGKTKTRGERGSETSTRRLNCLQCGCKIVLLGYLMTDQSLNLITRQMIITWLACKPPDFTEDFQQEAPSSLC